MFHEKPEGACGAAALVCGDRVAAFACAACAGAGAERCGRMILPVGTGVQQLVVLEKTGDTFKEIPDIHVRFVPMVEGKELGD